LEWDLLLLSDFLRLLSLSRLRDRDRDRDDESDPFDFDFRDDESGFSGFDFRGGEREEDLLALRSLGGEGDEAQRGLVVSASLLRFRNARKLSSCPQSASSLPLLLL